MFDPYSFIQEKKKQNLILRVLFVTGIADIFFWSICYLDLIVMGVDILWWWTNILVKVIDIKRFYEFIKK